MTRGDRHRPSGRRRTRGWPLLLLAAGFASPGPGALPAQLPPDTARVVPDIHLPDGRQAPLRLQAQWAARTRWVLREAAYRFGDGTVIRLHPDGAALHHLYRRDGPLTPPSAAPPLQIARKFLSDHRDLLGLTEEGIAGLRTVKSYVTRHNGVRHLLLQQTIDGVPVFHGEVRINLTRNGEIVNVGGNLHPDLPPPRATLLAPHAAVERAAASIGTPLGRVLAVTSQRGGPERKTTFEAGPFVQPVPVSLTFVALDGETRPAWVALLHEGQSGLRNVYQVLVDAVDGKVLHRINLVKYTAPEADIFPESPDPEGDGPDDDSSGVPDDELVRITFAPDPVASPGGWLYPSQTSTQGNSVIAVLDHDNDNDANGFKPDGGVNLHFFFPFANEWDANAVFGDQEAVVTNLFFHTARFHDYIHGLGFDEPAGNFQEDNFGRGGLGGDRVIAEAQDSAALGVRNNANFYTPPDGQDPRMQMYLWDTVKGRRDASLDSDIILHEYGHGVSERLVGGALQAGCVAGVQSLGMGEGWSDYFAIDDTNDPLVDDPNGPEVMGEYASGRYGHGIRTYKYSTSLAVNPWTYADVCTFSGSICSPHNSGEIWAATLFTARRNLIVDHGPGGREDMNRLVLDGMKLSPCGPTMLDMRDAILLADQINNAGINRCSLWSAFATRGLGWSASTSGDNDRFPVEAFDMPSGCGSAGTVAFGDEAFAAGDTLNIRVGDADLAGSGSVAVMVTAGTDVETVMLSELTGAEPGVFAGTLFTTPGPAQTQNGSLELAAGDAAATVSYDDADTGGGSPATVTDTAVRLTSLLSEGAEPMLTPSGWQHYAVAGPAGDRWRAAAGSDTEGLLGWHFWPGEPASDVYGDSFWGTSALESPTLDLRGIGRPRFDFEHRWAFGATQPTSPGDRLNDSPAFPGEGGIVELRVLPDGGWMQLTPVGGYPSYMTGIPVPHSSDACFSPMAFRDGYAQTSDGVEPAAFDLSPFAGRQVRLRFRAGTDCASVEPVDGWRIDSLRLSGANSSDGAVFLDRDAYDCEGELSVSVSDADLAGGGTVPVTLTSSPTGDSEVLILVERSDLPGSFVGSMQRTLDGAAIADGRLTVRDGDTIQAEYTDADDGMGGFGVVGQATAAASCLSEVVHFADGFEGGAPGWSHAVESGSVTDRWGLDGRWTHGGDNAFLSGPPDDLTVDSTATGATVLVSPPVTVPSGTGGTHFLRFHHLLDMNDDQESFCAFGNAWIRDGGLMRIDQGGAFNIAPEGGYPDTFHSSGCAPSPPYDGDAGWAIDRPHEYREERFDLSGGGVVEDLAFDIRFTMRTDCQQCFLPQGWWIDDVEVFTEILDSDGDGTTDGADACPFDALDDADSDSMCADVDADDDGDAQADGVDNCPRIANSLQTDSDSDGAGDACDNCPADANADQADADDDGLGDACDLCPAVASVADGDSDGWPDGCDNCPATTNPSQDDGDADGTGDACDACPAETDADADGSGCQSGDNCPQDSNPGQDDADTDGVGDVCDNCPAAINGAQVDTDSDGAGDACDACPFDFDDPTLDADADGVPDACDNCRLDVNAGQTDTDSDGYGDACDSCPSDFGLDIDGDALCGAGDTDTDGDGVLDGSDNCPWHPNTDQSDADADGSGDLCDNCNLDVNAGQADADLDGVGDACDPCPFDPRNDPDHDGVCNDADNCPRLANTGQTDTDSDGVGDDCDNCVTLANTSQIDADGDSFGAACDLDDADPACVTAVGEVAALDWSDETTLTWTSVAGAYAYTVRRADGGLVFDDCLDSPLPGTVLADTQEPLSGELFAYIVSAVGTCGPGSTGNPPRTVATCGP